MVAKGYLLGVDIGTYESKGVLATPEGRIVCTQVRPHGLSIPRQGWAEHDAEVTWWGDFCAITRGLLAESQINPKEVLAVACSSIGPDMLPVDARGRPLRPAVLYGIDTRAAQEIKELEEIIGREAIYARCGTRLSAQSVGPKILWLRHNEQQLYKQAYKFVTGTTFLVARLTGSYVVDHYSAASFDPMYDPARREWIPEFCDHIVEIERLPEIRWATEVAGSVTRSAAAQTGLREGTPVITGTIDAAAEAVSVGVVNPGEMMLMYGSTIFMIEVVRTRMTDPRLWSAPYLFPATHCLMAGMATSGALTRWFRDNFAKELVEAEKAGGGNAYALLMAQAATIPPGAEGLVLLPYFSGERTPINDPLARGVLFGLTLAHSRAHVYRAVLEGTAYGVRHHLDVLGNMGASPQRIVAVGGGTQNPLWVQIVSDVCGRAQHVPEVTIGASYGDAFLAGLGVGEIASYSGIARWLQHVRTVEPNLELARKYEAYYGLYREIYNRTRDLMHSIHKIM